MAARWGMPSASWRFAVRPGSTCCAVLHGGDRDTLGAMACAISGAYLGVEAIPHEWRGRLENGEAIEGLAVRLASMA